MAESSIAGLFQDPLLYQQAQDQAAFKRFAELAQLDPLQQAQASLMYGGYQAGGALGRALGAEDPMLQQLSMRNQLASQFDTSSAEGLINLSNALRQKGDLAGASQVAQQAMVAREKEANIQAKLAEKLTPQQKNAAAMADSQYQRSTPEWMAAYNKNLSELANPEKLTTDQRNYDAAVQGGYKGSFNEWLMQKAKAGATNVSVTTGENAYGTEFGKGIAGQDLAKYSLAQKAPDILASADVTEKLLQSGKVLTGTGASAKLNVLALGQALGATGKNTDEIIANTQQLQQQRSQAVLNQIKSSGLGTGQGFTDKDLKFLQDSAAGSIALSKETLQRQIEVERKIARAAAKDWNSRLDTMPQKVIGAMGLAKIEIPTEKPKMAVPKVGDVVDNHVFLGGDPSKPSSWRKQ